MFRFRLFVSYPNHKYIGYIGQYIVGTCTETFCQKRKRSREGHKILGGFSIPFVFLFTHLNLFSKTQNQRKTSVILTDEVSYFC